MAQNYGLFISSRVTMIPMFEGKNIIVPMETPIFVVFCKHIVSVNAQKTNK